jgi:branched-chain amino acid aminotransferase/4-amino-4-deoxychorismate lyase
VSLLEIPISDAGFRHGVGVFETVRVKGGKARWRDWHLESIHRSAKALGLKVEEKEFKQVPQGDGLWRWFVTDTGTRSWWCEGLEKVSPTVSLKMGKLGVWSDSWEARYKTMSYLSRIQAREGQREGGEVVMLNERGEIASASMANLFWVKDGKLRTPARECGCRAGTVRRWVFERSGQKVEEGRWKKEELDGAEEIFLTNARIGIKPVISWHEKKLASTGLAETLAKAFWAE